MCGGRIGALSNGGANESSGTFDVDDRFQADAGTAPIIVRLQLHRGVARTVVAPVAVVGDRSPLRTWLERQHGATFVSFVPRQRSAPSSGAALAGLATPASGPWRYVMTLRTNVRRQHGTRLGNDLSDALDYAMRQWSPSEIVVLPLTWRDPVAVATNTLMALWLLAWRVW